MDILFIHGIIHSFEPFDPKSFIFIFLNYICNFILHFTFYFPYIYIFFLLNNIIQLVNTSKGLFSHFVCLDQLNFYLQLYLFYFKLLMTYFKLMPVWHFLLNTLLASISVLFLWFLHPCVSFMSIHCNCEALKHPTYFHLRGVKFTYVAWPTRWMNHRCKCILLSLKPPPEESRFAFTLGLIRQLDQV